MKCTFHTVGIFAVSSALVASSASAQVRGVDLNGRYICVSHCLAPPGSFAFVTQNGWELNVVNEAGQASRAWVNYPGRLWFDRPQQAAIYSPDGLTIQFDGGTIWMRAPAPRLQRFYK
jgi:hypothetical protein